MEIKPIEDRNQLDNFIKAQNITSGSFLQSYQWGEFQKNFGFKIWRFGYFEKNELVGVTLIIKHPLPFGKSYLYCPKGPVIQEQSEKSKVQKNIFDILFEKVNEIAKEEKAIFFRFEPPVAEDQFDLIRKNLGVIPTQPVQPKINWLLDLKFSLDEILFKMKQKTRYNIHLAERKNIKVRTSCDPNDVEYFFPLLKETAEKNKFKTHPKEYYRKMVENFSNDGLSKFYIAEYNQKIIAVNLTLSFDKTMSYLHGGSSYEYRNLMAPYILHWQAIKDAKKQGMEYYDFGGISPEEQSDHKWAGISRFKKGFGGFPIDSAGTFDEVLNPWWYRLYLLGRKLT